MNPTLVNAAKKIHHTKINFLEWLLPQGHDFAFYTYGNTKPRYGEIFTPAKDNIARANLAALLADKNWIPIESESWPLATNPQEKPNRKYFVDLVNLDKNITPVRYTFLARPKYVLDPLYKEHTKKQKAQKTVSTPSSPVAKAQSSK